MGWMPQRLPNHVVVAMFGLVTLIYMSGFLKFIPVSNSSPNPNLSLHHPPSSFTDMNSAFAEWDSLVGCHLFRDRYRSLLSNTSSALSSPPPSPSLQDVGVRFDCGLLKMPHVSVLVKGWTWIPDNLDNLYYCRCGLTCLWTKSAVLADSPDALLFETTTPPPTRKKGDPLRVYMDLEAGRKPSRFEDIFVSYHAEDDVQSTYAGAFFHNNRNYRISATKNNETLVYWSSSRCLRRRDRVAQSLLRLVPHHSFGKCLNNVGGPNTALTFYPECKGEGKDSAKWWGHLHCVMSHYKFVLAIENTVTDSYVTEKLFYALDSGAVPVYFGARNVLDFVPPGSVIVGSDYGSMELLAEHLKRVGSDPAAYMEYHAWRRCGVVGGYGKTRAVSLDTLPCRLCEAVSKRGGRDG